MSDHWKGGRSSHDRGAVESRERRPLEAWSLLALIVLAVIAALGILWLALARPDGLSGSPVRAVPTDAAPPSSPTLEAVELVPTRSVEAPSRVAESAPTTAVDVEPVGTGKELLRFRVRVVDERSAPLEGVSCNGSLFRAAASDAGASRSGGSWSSGRRAHVADLDAVRTDARGRAEFICEQRGPGPFQLSVSLYPPPRSPFAEVRRVKVTPGEEVVVVMERAGTLTVRLATLPVGGGAHTLRVMRGRGDERTRGDVRLSLIGSDGRTVYGNDRTAPPDLERWSGLRPGTYRLEALPEGIGVGAPIAVLEDLVVPPGADCTDPRLEGWNPFEGVEPMWVRVSRLDGDVPDPLEVGFLSRNALASARSRYGGEPIPIVANQGGASHAFLEAEGTRRVELPIEPGVRDVVLPDAIRLTLIVDATAVRPDATGPTSIRRLRGPGERPISSIAREIVFEAGVSRSELLLPLRGTYVLQELPRPLDGAAAPHAPEGIDPVEFTVPDAPSAVVSLRVDR